MRFDIDSSDCNGTRRIAVNGELDVATAPLLADRLADAEVGDADTIVLDLDGVTFMDSTGLHMILNCHARSQANGGRLRLTHGSPPVQRLFELTGAVTRLPFVD